MFSALPLHLHVIFCFHITFEVFQLYLNHFQKIRLLEFKGLRNFAQKCAEVINNHLVPSSDVEQIVIQTKELFNFFKLKLKINEIQCPLQPFSYSN